MKVEYEWVVLDNRDFEVGDKTGLWYNSPEGSLLQDWKWSNGIVRKIVREDNRFYITFEEDTGKYFTLEIVPVSQHLIGKLKNQPKI